MYGDNTPMRLGILLYSSKLIKYVQENGGELVPSTNTAAYDSGEDVSILVIYFHGIFVDILYIFYKKHFLRMVTYHLEVYDVYTG